METLMQFTGDALRVRDGVIAREYDRGWHIHDLLNRFMHVVVVTGSQSAARNALHRVEARMCKRLLMSSDGVGSAEVALTQREFDVSGLRIPAATALRDGCSEKASSRATCRRRALPAG